MQEYKMTDMTWPAIVEWFGETDARKMAATGYLNGVTCTINEKGETVYFRDDIERAYRAMKGEPIHPKEWD